MWKGSTNQAIRSKAQNDENQEKEKDDYTDEQKKKLDTLTDEGLKDKNELLKTKEGEGIVKTDDKITTETTEGENKSDNVKPTQNNLNTVFVESVVRAANQQSEELARAASLQSQLVISRSDKPIRTIVTYDSIPILARNGAILPYYQFVDGGTSDFQVPSFFDLETTFDQNYVLDETLRLAILTEQMAKDNPILEKSIKTFQQGTIKVIPKWSNTFLPSIPDPENLGNELINANLMYVNTSNNTYLLSLWLYHMLECTLAGIAAPNIILCNLEYATLSDITTRNIITESLEHKKIMRTGIAHPTFAGAFSQFVPLVDAVINDLYRAQHHNSRPQFELAVETSFARLKLDSYAKVSTDQYTAALLEIDFRRLKFYRLDIEYHQQLVRACYPASYFYDFKPPELYNLTLTYMPSRQQIRDSLLYILMSGDVKNKFIEVFKNVFNQMDVLRTASEPTKILSAMNDVTARSAELAGSFSSEVANAIRAGSNDVFLDLLTAEFFGPTFYDVNVTTRIQSNFYLNIFIYVEVLTFFTLFPKIAWSSQVTLGKTLYSLLYGYHRKQFNDWQSHYGLFVQLDDNGQFNRIDMEVSSYTTSDLLNHRIYFSFLTEIGQRNNDRRFAFIRQIYELIQPLGRRINLPNKEEADLPYLRRDYTYYLSWNQRPKLDCTTNSQISNRFYGIMIFLKTAIDLSADTKHIVAQKSTMAWIGEITAILSPQGERIGPDFHCCLATMFSIFADTGLSINDNFNERHPYLQTPLLGFGSSSNYVFGSPENECITCPNACLNVDTKIIYYILTRQSTIVNFDVSTVGEGIISSNSEQFAVPMFDGSTISNFMYDVFCQSRHFVEMLYIFYHLSIHGDNPVFRRIRNALRGMNTASTSMKLLRIISKVYNYPLDTLLQGRTFGNHSVMADPRFYKITPHFIDTSMSKLPVQEREVYRVGDDMVKPDDFFLEKLDIYGNMFLSDISPIYRISTGIAFGMFPLRNWSPDTILDEQCDYPRVTLG